MNAGEEKQEASQTDGDEKAGEEANGVDEEKETNGEVKK